MKSPSLFTVLLVFFLESGAVRRFTNITYTTLLWLRVQSGSGYRHYKASLMPRLKNSFVSEYLLGNFRFPFCMIADVMLEKSSGCTTPIRAKHTTLILLNNNINRLA